MKIFLIELKTQHATKKYLNWLKDSSTNEYTEFRFQKYSLNDVKKNIKLNLKSKTNFLYGIFIKELKAKKLIHIGNIKLGGVDYIHKFGEISYFIGDKDYLNKNIGYKSIQKILDLAKKKFKLRKIYAGTYSNNKISKKVLKKNGFKQEAKIKKKFLYKKIYVDHDIFSKNL